MWHDTIYTLLRQIERTLEKKIMLHIDTDMDCMMCWE